MLRPLDGGDPLDFEALLYIDRDNAAEGYVHVPLSERGGTYEAFFGAIVPDRNSSTGFGFVVFGTDREITQ